MEEEEEDGKVSDIVKLRIAVRYLRFEPPVSYTGLPLSLIHI